jgi:hypothetical protein
MEAGPRVSEHDAPTTRSCTTCGALLERTHLEESLDGWHCVFCGARQAPPVDERTERPGPMGVGATFIQAREARRESLEHAARETNINERFLQALEDDAPPDAFPGEIYGRFFLREYAEYLGLEPGPLLRRYDRATSTPELEPLTDPALPKDPARHTRLVTVIAAIVLVAVAAFSWWAAGRPDDGAPIRVASSAPSPPAATAAASHGNTGSRPPQTTPGLRASILVQAPCWIEVTLDGRTIPGRTRPAGTRLALRADHTMQLTLGNAGGAQVLVNGRRITTGGSGEVVDLSFAWRDGHVVDRSV